MTKEKTTATFLGRHKQYGKWIPYNIEVPVLNAMEAEQPEIDAIKYCKEHIMEKCKSNFAEITKFRLN